MPRLCRFADIGQSRVGFLFPIFRKHEGSNDELVQKIAGDDRVFAFEECIIGTKGSIYNVPAFSLELNDPSLWAFRDEAGKVHVGTTTEIRRIGVHLLEQGRLEGHPIAAAELAAFCLAEQDFQQIILQSFQVLTSISKFSADLWRDVILLLPMIKRDIHYMNYTATDLSWMDNILAFSKGPVTHIYVPQGLQDRIGSVLPNFQALAKVFDIDRFEIHSLKPTDTRKSVEKPNWIVVGVGGIARYLFRKSVILSRQVENPFQKVVIASGRSVSEDGTLSAVSIAVSQSDAKDVDAVAKTIRSSALPNSVKHLVNVRPIGFGTPASNKLSPADLRSRFPEFDFIWIVSNHRKRQVRFYATSLGASQVASITVKAVTFALIACLLEKKTTNIIDELKGTRQFGLIGRARHDSLLGVHDNLRRAIYDMLCEDADLASAKRIVVLWPTHISRPEGYVRIEIGGLEYFPEIMTRPGGQARDIVALAIGVNLLKRTASEFSSFCRSLLAGFGWRVRSNLPGHILLENEGEALRVWPAASSESLARLISESSDFDPHNDLIVTNQTISINLRELAARNKVEAIHYSLLERWMQRKYDLRIYNTEIL